MKQTKKRLLGLNIQYFAGEAGPTKIADLINPEVMGDMISAELPKKIKFLAIAPIDTTLQGQPGNTITLPKYKYIGDAEDVAEGEAIDYKKLTTTDSQVTIKKAAKGVSMTDESVLSGYGDPIGEATKQVTMSIASKIDNDTVEVLKTAPLSVESDPGKIDVIDQIENTFDDETDETGVIFLSYKDAASLRKEAANGFTRASELGDNILIKGAFGEVLGWTIIRTKKLVEGEALAVKAGAAKTYLKRGVSPESGRDIDRKLTKFNADQHYVVALADDTKVVKVTKSKVIPEPTLSLSQATLALKVGGEKTITATAVPAETAYEWFSEDDATATVSEGSVTAVKEGTTNIGVKTTDGAVVATCKVTISPVE